MDVSVILIIILLYDILKYPLDIHRALTHITRNGDTIFIHMLNEGIPLDPCNPCCVCYYSTTSIRLCPIK